MKHMCLFLILNLIAFAVPAFAESRFESDLIPTGAGDLKITFIGHGSLMLAWNGKNIQVDPYGELADYTEFPKADLILITHEHGDHLDLGALAKIRTDATRVIMTEACAEKLPGGIILRNGDRQTLLGIEIEAVPAYNLVHKRDDGGFFHPKGSGNGYLLTCGDKKVYIAGDTENTPEMKALKGIDVAFLPMNLPYTMTPEMVVDAVMAFRPRVLYPYHFGKTDLTKIQDLLKGEKDIELRLRKME
jgi:L-ascorbate metabolism protein UlaG (beta-lactamase superfamily)